MQSDLKKLFLKNKSIGIYLKKDADFKFVFDTDFEKQKEKLLAKNKYTNGHFQTFSILHINIKVSTEEASYAQSSYLYRAVKCCFAM
jgi:hypothetical protein